MKNILSPEVTKQAACKGQKTAIFYADEGPISSKDVRVSISKAKTLCRQCPIQIECLYNAVNNKEEFGIWGGLTTKERLRILGDKATLKEIEKVVLWTRNT